MQKIFSRDEALGLLKEAGCSPSVVEHCLAVTELALEIANKIRENGHDVDLEFVESAALLHDIGRSKTHDVEHGVVGAEILKDYPAYARVCECHLGAGIDRGEAESIGLPARDYFPESLEEKIITHADNLIDHDKIAPLELVLKELKEILGEDHPAINRVIELDKYINSLMKEKR
ncbi:TIGR00295 family protein [Candidatus Altiarchaeota archaeon]